MRAGSIFSNKANNYNNFDFKNSKYKYSLSNKTSFKKRKNEEHSFCMEEEVDNDDSNINKTIIFLELI